MIICKLQNEELFGGVTFEYGSYIVRVYKMSELRDEESRLDVLTKPIYYMSFGDGTKAEDRLIELLEQPAWTILKYG